MHGNFSSQYSEGSSNLSAEEGLMTHFLFFFSFSKEFAGSVGAARQTPNLAPLENDFSQILHIP